MEKKVPSSDKNFISFLLNYICEHKAEDMRLQMEELSKYMHDLPPKCEPNLFRKQYGNLKACIKLPTVSLAFNLDNNLILFQKPEQMLNCKQQGVISEEDYKKYLVASDIYWTHKLTLVKSLDQNICKVCQDSYKVIVNHKGLCTNGEAHTPKYDWSKSPDVLKCLI